DHRLPDALAHLQTDRARDGVGDAAGGEGDDEADRLRGKLLRRRRMRRDEACRERDEQPHLQSALIPFFCTTPLHFSSSFFRNAVYSSGAIVRTSIAWRASCSRKAGLAATRSSSARSRRTGSAGVRAGTSSVYHEGTSTPSMPLSASVGTSGASGVRSGLVTASATRRPARTYASDDAIEPNTICASPASTALAAGPAPLYGMWTMSMPATFLNSSVVRCRFAPVPLEA